jgi:hypothetical protein
MRIRGAATGEQNVPVTAEQFDRWLAEHDAEVRRDTCERRRLRGYDIEQEYIDHVIANP